MGTACSALFCKRCGVFGHYTDGCVAECKRCGGKHGTRECFRKRSYVAAARGIPSITGDAPNNDSISAISNAPEVPSGLQVLKPRAAPQLGKQPSPYWDSGENNETSETATTPSEQQTTRSGEDEFDSACSDDDEDRALEIVTGSSTEEDSAGKAQDSGSDA